MKTYDAIIVGAGAAGLMTAIQAGRRGLSVLLLDGQKKVGAKILMSGGTRCNVTNEVITEKDYESESIRIARQILQGFSSRETLSFFEALGVTFIREEGGKYFPDTDSGKTILDALLKALHASGAELEFPRRVTTITARGSAFDVKGEDFHYTARKVVLTTGGLSYPQTGSDGFGYDAAQSFGHSLVRTTASLTPLQTEERRWRDLKGVAVPCRLTLWVDGKKGREYEGPFLFTHFGFSGPAVLNISRHWLGLRQDHKVDITWNLLPQLTPDRAAALFTDASFGKRTVKNVLTDHLPERLVVAILEEAGIERDQTLSHLSKGERQRLIHILTAYPVPISGAIGYSKAEVTAGGIPLSEVNRLTLESKFCPGLHFAGEVLDVDGRIGGFNFQWAWASGTTAARAL